MGELRYAYTSSLSDLVDSALGEVCHKIAIFETTI